MCYLGKCLPIVRFRRLTNSKGRPWNDLAVTVYLRTFMDNTVRPAGWTPFDSARYVDFLPCSPSQLIQRRPVILNTTFYAEFNSSGPGGNTSARVPIEHFLTPSQARDFTPERVFLEHPSWIDFEYLI